MTQAQELAGRLEAPWTQTDGKREIICCEAAAMLRTLEHECKASMAEIAYARDRADAAETALATQAKENAARVAAGWLYEQELGNIFKTRWVTKWAEQEPSGGGIRNIRPVFEARALAQGETA